MQKAIRMNNDENLLFNPDPFTSTPKPRDKKPYVQKKTVYSCCICGVIDIDPYRKLIASKKAVCSPGCLDKYFNLG